MATTHRSEWITRPPRTTTRGRRPPQHQSTEPWQFPRSGHEKEEREERGGGHHHPNELLGCAKNTPRRRRGVWKGDGEAVAVRVGLCLSHPAGATRAEGLPVKIHLILCPIYVFSLCLPEKIKDFRANVDGFFQWYIYIYITPMMILVVCSA
jgi:hypothetical protein